MAIPVRCNRVECRHHRPGFAVKDTMAGKRILCPACGTGLKVPGHEETRESSTADGRSASSGVSPWIYLGTAGGILLVLLAITFWLVLLDRSSPAQETAIVQVDPAPRPSPPEQGPGIPPRMPEGRPTVTMPPSTPSPPKSEDFPPGQRFALPLEVLGDQRRLQAVQVTEVTGKSTFGTTVTFTWRSPTRCKFEESRGPKTMGMIVDGDRGWLVMSPGPARPLMGPELAKHRDKVFALGLSNLLSLKDHGFEFVTAGKDVVKGKPSIKVRASAPGMPALHMYFDQETQTLRKSEYQEGSGLLEVFFSDYRQADGILHWHHAEQFRAGRKYAELNVTRIRFLDREEPGMFEPPAPGGRPPFGK